LRLPHVAARQCVLGRSPNYPEPRVSTRAVLRKPETPATTEVRPLSPGRIRPAGKRSTSHRDAMRNRHLLKPLCRNPSPLEPRAICPRSSTGHTTDPKIALSDLGATEPTCHLIAGSKNSKVGSGPIRSLALVCMFCGVRDADRISGRHRGIVRSPTVVRSKELT